MKKVKHLLTLLLAVVIVLSACSMPAGMASKEEKLIPGILLCGEAHSYQRCIDRELERWGELYSKGARHLFVEDSYAFTQFINEWMKAEDDMIFDSIYENYRGTQGYSVEMVYFFHSIKDNYPETVFHGIDIEHQYRTTGEMYLEKLRNEGKEDSEEYKLCTENIEQATETYSIEDMREYYSYREAYMVENFIREYESLKDEFVMGIFGAAHTDPEALNYSQSAPNFAGKLIEKYGDLVQTEEMVWRDSIRMDRIAIDGKEYDAAYFGLDDEREWGDDCESLEVWRIDDAYDDFKNNISNEMWLGYSCFPEKIETGRVYMFRLKYYDGSVYDMLFRSDEDYMYEGMRCLVGFEVNRVNLISAEEDSEGNDTEDIPESILLCGEVQNDETSFNNELKSWEELYVKGARHLFIENSYAYAALLNRWMKEDSDDILNQLLEESEITKESASNINNFYKLVKEKFPETVFHGTDINRQFETIGKRYLEILKSEGKEGTEEYRCVELNNEQGKSYCDILNGKEADLRADSFRETCLAENFLKECTNMHGETIMGIYKRGHVTIDW
ncbi:MAG: hypothetical protein K6E39_04205, partial [Lachnospiraceae bacterium]|nr:hypothetical protein [Lachnospiraceae bacterium]